MIKFIHKHTILIDATGARTISAICNIKFLYEHILNQDDDSIKYIFFTSNDFLKSQDTSTNINIINYKLLSFLPFRIIWSTILIPFIGIAYKAKLIFSPFDIGPFFKFNSILILAVRNPNLILPRQLQNLKYPSIHKIVSYLSSINTNLIIYPSYYAKNNISKFLYTKPSEVIYHGIDLEYWRKQKHISNLNDFHLSQGSYILFCSPFYKFKNLETLILAYNLYINKSNEKLNLIFIGKFVSKDYELNILSLIKNFKLEKKIIFLSNLELDDVICFYKNATVICITSLYETFGHMYLESLLSNKPVICSKTDIAQEISANFPYYFEPENYFELSKILIDSTYLVNYKNNVTNLNNWINKFSTYNENNSMINIFKNFIK